MIDTEDVVCHLPDPCDCFWCKRWQGQFTYAPSRPASGVEDEPEEYS